MDDREQNPSISSERRSSIAPHSIRVRDALLGVLAVAVVVATHFGYPVLVMQFATGLSITLVWMGLFLVALIGVIAIPIGGTTFILEKIRYLSDNHDEEVWGWPWLFAAPSIIAFGIYVISSAWIDSIPQTFEFMRIYLARDTNLGSWLVVASTILLLGTEMKIGLLGNKSGLDARNQIRVGDKVSDSLKYKSPDDQNERIRPVETGEFSFDWKEPPRISFTDVGGMSDVKDNIIRRVINPRNTASIAYKRFRVSPPTGILLYGPPGSGKTYLARAIAGELGSPYVELSQADLSSMWINESPAKVRRLFEEAEMFESSVIFIDEIDGLVRARDANAHNEDSKVVSEFLARLAEEDTNYLIIAATNRPDQMDSAVLRPGRFDEQFEIGVPDTKAREEIFKVQLRGRRPSLSDADYRELGERTDGYTAADIASIVERAALNAAERDAKNITLDDLSSCF